MTNDKQANARVRAAMAKAGIRQKDLAEILEVSEPALSAILGVELDSKVQTNIIRKIEEARR